MSENLRDDGLAAAFVSVRETYGPSQGAPETAPLGSPGIVGQPELQRPTMPGLVDGIVGWNPCVLQCRDCGLTVTQPHQRSLGVFILTAGWEFHICEGVGAGRRCRDCLATAKAACDKTTCQDDAGRARRRAPIETAP